MPKFIVYTRMSRIEVVADYMYAMEGKVGFHSRSTGDAVALLDGDDIVAFKEGTDIKVFDGETGEQYIPPPPVSPNE